MSVHDKSLDLLWDLDFSKNEEFEDFEAEGVTPQSFCSMAASRSRCWRGTSSSPSLRPSAYSTPLNRGLVRDKRDKQHQQLLEAAEKLAQELKMKKKPSPHSNESFEIEKVDAAAQTEKSYINMKYRQKCKRKQSSDGNSPTAVIILFDEFHKPTKVICTNVNRNFKYL